MAEIGQPPSPLDEFGVLGGYASTFHCREGLGGVKTKGLRHPRPAHRLLAGQGAEGWCGIIQDRDAMLGRDRIQCLVVGGDPVGVNSEDSAGGLPDAGLEARGIECEGANTLNTASLYPLSLCRFASADAGPRWP